MPTNDNEENIFERVNAYCCEDSNGDTCINIHGLAVDLVMVAKAGQIPAEELHLMVATIWDDMTVEIIIPNNL